MERGARTGGPGAGAWTVLALGAMAAIFLASSIPGEPIEVGGTVIVVPPTLQNLLHVPVYAFLCWLWWRSFVARGRSPRAALVRAAVIAVAYGVLDEMHQALVPGRYASVTDALLNAAGAAGVAAWLRIRNQVRFFHRAGGGTSGPT